MATLFNGHRNAYHPQAFSALTICAKGPLHVIATSVKFGAFDDAVIDHANRFAMRVGDAGAMELET
jgi:hypothetical protein